MNRNISFFVLRTVCCLFLFFSCSTNRKSRTNTHTFVSDSLHYVKRDSLYLSHLLESSIQRTLRLKHITLSKPDTLGRQYAETVSVLVSNTTGQQCELAEEVSFQTDEQKQLVTSSKEIKQENRKYKNPLFFVAGIIIVVIIFRKCRN